MRLVDAIDRWALTELPALNRAIIAGGQQPAALTERLTRDVLADLPLPEALSPAVAQRLLVDLAFAGASVARHYQEADLGRKAAPQEGFRGLTAGSERIPFLHYFARLAAWTGTGHSNRDSYASLVRWNVDTTELYWEGQRIAELRGAFDDGQVRTYTGDLGERRFFELIKKSETVELAANRMLEPLSDGLIDLRSEEGVRRVGYATVLLAALRQLSLDFAALPVGEGLRADHFLDVFRQFAVHWEPGDIPPSGALDPEYLKRDFLLGIAFPGYGQHVQRVFPALLSDERLALTALLERPPLPVVLLRSLGLAEETLAAMSVDELRAALRKHPELAVWYQLLSANARVSGAHLMLSKKYLFKPEEQREKQGGADSGLVSNRMGTTGMTKSSLERLARARKAHALFAFHRLPASELTAAVGQSRWRPLSPEDLVGLVRFVAPSAPTELGPMAVNAADASPSGPDESARAFASPAERLLAPDDPWVTPLKPKAGRARRH